MSITVFAPDNESKFDIEKVVHIYQHRELIQQAIAQYDKKTESSV
jgi:hypothetical protein